MVRRRALALISTFLAGTAAAQALDLAQIYQAARRHDMSYRESGASYREARTLAPAARSAFLPHISAQANSTYNDLTSRILGGTPGFTFPSGHFTFNSNGYGISVSEALLDIHALYAYQAAGRSVRAAAVRHALAKSELILAVCNRYFGFLLARDDLDLQRAEGRALHAEYARALRSFRLGRATITDANEARARYDAVRAEQVAAQNAVRLARARLERMTAGPAYGLWSLNLAAPLPRPRRGALSVYEAKARRENLVLQAARLEARVATAQARAAGAARYPTITAEAAYSYSRAGASEFGFGTVLHDKTIGIDLAVPIYQGGELSAQEARAAAAAFKARVAELRTAREVAFDVHEAFLNVRTGYRQIRALQAAEKAAQVALASERLGVRVGVRNNVDVLRAEQAYFRSRRNLARATYGYILSRLDLKAAVSHLTAGDIERVNARLLPPGGPAAQTGAGRAPGHGQRP